MGSIAIGTFINAKQGAVAIATTRGTAKKQMLLDHVSVINEEDLATRVREITSGHGVDLIILSLKGKRGKWDGPRHRRKKCISVCC